MAPQRSQSDEHLAGKALLNRLDHHAHLRNALREIAQERDLWSGIPMPLDGERLVVEPTYPNASGLMSIGQQDADDEPGMEDIPGTVRNVFNSAHKRSDVIIFSRPDGKVDWGIRPGVHHFTNDLRTLGCSDAWGIEQEHTAMNLLGTLLRHRAFKQYLLTGMFLESSKRSGVTYVFRRLRPTVAISQQSGKLHILCALCLHPIAYYAGSWAGAMCPTDDVIAHLMLMRGDEAMFWRRANHHPAWSPLAGL